MRLKFPPSRCLAALVVVLCVACGGSGPKLFPVSGKVLFEGQPAAGATVVFQPVQGEVGVATPSGIVDADGSFTLRTHPHGQGAPAGEYAILVSWFDANARSTGNAVNKLPPKYSEAISTPLPRITLKAGPNQLEPFLLTK